MSDDIEDILAAMDEVPDPAPAKKGGQKPQKKTNPRTNNGNSHNQVKDTPNGGKVVTLRKAGRTRIPYVHRLQQAVFLSFIYVCAYGLWLFFQLLLAVEEIGSFTIWTGAIAIGLGLFGLFQMKMMDPEDYGED